MDAQFRIGMGIGIVLGLMAPLLDRLGAAAARALIAKLRRRR